MAQALVDLRKLRADTVQASREGKLRLATLTKTRDAAVRLRTDIGASASRRVSLEADIDAADAELRLLQEARTRAQRWSGPLKPMLTGKTVILVLQMAHASDAVMQRCWSAGMRA